MCFIIPCFGTFLLSRRHCFAVQDDSDSDGDSAEGTSANRRFFGRRRRQLSNDNYSASIDRQHTEGRLRRMSNAMSRRPRTVPATGSSDGVDGGSGPIVASSPAPGEAGSAGNKVDRGGKEVASASAGAAGAGAAGETDAGPADAGRGDAAAKGEQDTQEALPPPITMALAVMLTGLRLFVVDQVRRFKTCGSNQNRAWPCGLCAG